MPNVEIKLDLSPLSDISQEALNAALETMGALRTEILTAQVTPKDTGKLEESGGAIDQFADGSEIHTTLCIGDTPYARRLYFHPEYNFQTVNNPNAQGEWAQPWLPGGDLEGFVPDAFAGRLEERLK
jgi:hypothetical protein